MIDLLERKKTRSLTNMRNIYKVRKRDFIERYCDLEKWWLGAKTPNTRFARQYPAMVIDMYNWSKMRFIRTHNKAVADGAIQPEITNFESPDLGIPQELVK